MSLLDTLLDPERRQRAQEDQAKLESVMGPRVMRQPPQAKYLYGLARERMALDQIAQVTGSDAQSHPEIFNLLAEGLALQGKFAAAAEVAPDGVHKHEYLAKASAVEKINEQQCSDPLKRPIESHGLSAAARNEHPGAEAGVKARQEATQLPMEKIWNGKQIITFTRCLICGSISAYA